MSKLTALQEAMRIVEKYAHNLFNIYNSENREFLDEVSKCLDLEREQILHAYREGRTDEQSPIEKYHNRTAAQHYNETYKENQ
jgi:hypothetical protein